MKTIRLITLLLFGIFWYLIISGLCHAACVGPALSAVQAAVTAASRGDTVEVCSGSATWTTSLNITKSITLQGAGVGVTNITTGFTPSSVDAIGTGESLIFFQSSSISSDSNVLFRVTGFTFDLTSGSYHSSGININNLTNTPLKNVRIDNNNFVDSYYKGGVCSFSWFATIFTYGPIYGVIDSNTMDSGEVHIAFGGRNQNTWDNKVWSYGSSESMYVEDNHFTAGPCGIPTDNSQGMTVVFRYNDWSWGTSSWHYFDMYNPHGNNYKTTVYSSMGGEAYGNKVYLPAGNTTTPIRFADLRGGKSVMFYNRIIANTSIQMREMESDYGAGAGVDSLSTTSYQCGSSISYLYPSTASCNAEGQPQHVWQTYLWNNRGGSTGIGTIMSVSNVNPCTTCTPPEVKLVENRQFYRDIAGVTFDGTLTSGKAGVGCGTLAARPATCTAGAGYWIPNATLDPTAASCTGDISSWVGKNNLYASQVNGNTGTLYKCGSGNSWTNIYTPYLYPHPLRAGSDIAPPVASGGSQPTGSQTCSEEDPTLVPVTFTVTDASTVTCYSCREGVGGCTSASTYDQIALMGAKTLYTSTDTGTSRVQTAEISSACNTDYKHWARCTDSAGNKMLSSIGITYQMQANDDPDDPELNTTTAPPTIDATGTELTLTFSEDVQIGTGGSTGWTLTRTRDGTPATVALTLKESTGSDVIKYTITEPILSTDTTVTVTYAQPEGGNGIVDKGAAPSAYCTINPDPAHNANLLCETPDGSADGLADWTIQRAQRYPDGAPLTGNVVSFTNDCYEASTATLDASYTISDGMEHWVNGYYATLAGQSFTSTGGTLHSVKFYLNKAGSPNGTLVAKLYDETGAYGTSSVPSGVALATSLPVSTSAITTYKQLITFTFTGDDKVTLDNGNHYVVTIEYLGTSGSGCNDKAKCADPATTPYCYDDGQNKIFVGGSSINTTTPGHGGNSVTNFLENGAEPYCEKGDPKAKNEEDLVFYVYKDSGSGESLGCLDIGTTNCIRLTKAQYAKDEDIYAFKKLHNTDITGDIYLQFYFRNMGQPTDSTGCECYPDEYDECPVYTCTGEENMLDGHDVELIGFTTGAKTTWDPLPADYDANVYIGIHQRGGKLTLSTFHYYLQKSACTAVGVPYTCCTGLRTGPSCISYNNHIYGTESIGVDGSKWIGVRLHIYNSTTAEQDWYKMDVDWNNNGTWTEVGNTGTGGGYWTASGGAPSWVTSAAKPITFSNPIRYIYMGQNDLEGKADFQITGIKLNTTGFPSACDRTGGANNPLADIPDPVAVTNNSTVGSLATQSLFSHTSDPTGYSTESTSDFNAAVILQSSQTGVIEDICFFKIASMTGTHIGTIYNSSGTVLGQVTFSGETASGWQCQAFATPINFLKNTYYKASVYFPAYWIRSLNFFTNGYTNTAFGGYLSTGSANGWYVFSTPGVPLLPTVESQSKSNYWIDVNVSYAGVTGPWEMTVTNLSATGYKCTITPPTASISNGEDATLTVDVANGWKAGFGGTCGSTATLSGNTYTYTKTMTADCTVEVTCAQKQVVPWIAP